MKDKKGSWAIESRWCGLAEKANHGEVGTLPTTAKESNKSGLPSSQLLLSCNVVNPSEYSSSFNSN